MSEQIANQQVDSLHQLSRWLVTEFDLIALEDLPLHFMNRRRRLSLSSHDAGFGLLRQMIEHKAAEAGIRVITSFK